MTATQKRNAANETIMTHDNKVNKKILSVRGEDKQHLGLTILELRFSSCRYVVGQNKNEETLFCGEVIHRVSYCQTHYSACHIKRVDPKF